MSLQFPIPAFTGQAVRYQGTSWVWDGVAWHIDREASRLDLALIPAYLAQLVHAVPAGPTTFISLSDRDLYGATYALATREPFEGVKVYLNGLLLLQDDGTGDLGVFQINRAANRIDFLVPLSEGDIVHIGVVTPPEMLAPGRVDIWPIQDLDFDWVTTPGTPIPGQVNGVRRDFDLTVLVPGGGQEFAIVNRPEELAVFIGGIRQQAGVDYVSLSSTITMTVAPQPGVSFWAMWYRPAGAGGAGGGSIDPPQPPQDTQLSTYNWVPGSGADWVDARGIALTVANAADRTGLRNGIDARAGKLVLQADTDELWRNTAPGWRRYLDAGLMGAAAAGGRIQHLRSSLAGQRPAAGGLTGQIWVNLSDGVIGWFNDAGDPVALFVPPDLTADVAARLPLAGGTMTGFIVLHASPTDPSHAASKAYVDAIDAAISAAFAVADNMVRDEFAAADGMVRAEFAAADMTVRGEFAAADTAIRNDFAAADTALQADINARLALTGGTMTGIIVARVAAAASASLRLPPGVAPTAPVNGDIWTTTAGVFARINGVTVDLTGGGAATHVGDAAPPAPLVPGQLWFRTQSPVGLFVWVQDATSTQWVQVGGTVGNPAALTTLTDQVEDLQVLVADQEAEITALRTTDMVKTNRITELAAAIADLEAREAARDAQQDAALAAVAARDSARDGRQDRRIAALVARIAALEARP